MAQTLTVVILKYVKDYTRVLHILQDKFTLHIHAWFHRSRSSCKKFHVTRQILASSPFATLISLIGCYPKFHCTSLYNLWLPARQTGAYPIELTGWWLDRRWLSIFIFPTTYLYFCFLSIF